MPPMAIEFLPRYQAIKVVEAALIVEVHGHRSGGGVLRLDLVDRDGHQLEHIVSRAYMEKHAPKAGGYYVRYADGYESWSPAAAFESGYVRITE